MKKTIDLDYEEEVICIKLPLTDGNLLEAHGFMIELNQEGKKAEPETKQEDQDHQHS